MSSSCSIIRKNPQFILNYLQTTVSQMSMALLIIAFLGSRGVLPGMAGSTINTLAYCSAGAFVFSFITGFYMIHKITMRSVEKIRRETVAQQPLHQ